MHSIASDLNISGDRPEIHAEIERLQEENSSLKQQLEIQSQVRRCDSKAENIQRRLSISLGEWWAEKITRCFRWNRFPVSIRTIAAVRQKRNEKYSMVDVNFFLSLRDKARLEFEIQGLTNQINALFEDIEKLTIQCDIHQSRSAASR